MLHSQMSPYLAGPDSKRSNFDIRILFIAPETIRLLPEKSEDTRTLPYSPACVTSGGLRAFRVAEPFILDISLSADKPLR